MGIFFVSVSSLNFLKKGGCGLFCWCVHQECLVVLESGVMIWGKKGRRSLCTVGDGDKEEQQTGKFAAGVLGMRLGKLDLKSSRRGVSSSSASLLPWEGWPLG